MSEHVRWNARQRAGDNSIDPFDALQTLAEIAIGVAGFTGIIAVFQRRSGAQSELARWRIYTILTTSLGALLFATLPMGFSLLHLPEPTLWRLASGVLIVGYGLIYGDLLRTRSRLSAASHETIALHPWYARTLNGMNFVLVVALALNATSPLFEAPAGVYFFGVLGVIATACTIFARTVFGPQTASTPGA